MSAKMERREFITLLGGVAAAWPLAARAQQPAMPVVGFLNALGQNDRPNVLAAFRRGLSEAGYVDGRNVAIESAGRQCHAGVSFFTTLIAGKGLGLLHELVPNAAVIALLVNPKLPESARMPSEAQEAARILGRQLLVLNASTSNEIDAAFATMRQRRASALFVGGDPFFSGRRQQIVALAARDAIPAMYTNREFVEEGGLMSYGNDSADAYRRAGVYVGRILNGASPADLPVDQATKFEFLINLKTAKTLGYEVPPGLSSMADEIIE